MNMVGHNYVGVEPVFSWLSMMNGFDDHIGDLGLAKRQRPDSPRIKQPVHSNKSLSGRGQRRQISIRRETAMEAPSEKYRLADGMVMWQPASVIANHDYFGGSRPKVTVDSAPNFL